MECFPGLCRGQNYATIYVCMHIHNNIVTIYNIIIIYNLYKKIHHELILIIPIQM